jgi:hypothetical protein
MHDVRRAALQAWKIANRNEDKEMEYNKPAITATVSAAATIQSNNIPKGDTTVQDHTSMVFASDPAYEADE